ncbi:DUF1343 domain-containing protein [Candidatus Babeliales bacterium]|nr:DUF1343 domain-containing protein [Candidatus Babeliales bacterium]
MKKQLIVFIKLICTIYLITILPQIISQRNKNHNLINLRQPVHQSFDIGGSCYLQVINKNTKTLLGIENLANHNKKFSQIKKLRLGIISNDPSKKNIDLLLEKGFKIKKIFLIKTSSLLKYKKIEIFNWEVQKTCLPIKHIENLDAIIFDIQDSGLRHDVTFAALLKTMNSAIRNNKQLIITDRPNPLGKCMEGPGDIPLRHAMTIGEIAIYLNKHNFEKSLNLTVVPLVNWKRDNPLYNIKNNGLFKNINSLNLIYSSSFLSILKEIEPIKIHINGKKTFQVILLPNNNNLSEWEIKYFKNLCSKLGIFCKAYSYWNKNKNINGLKIGVKKNINKFSAFNSLLTIIRFLKNRKNIKISFSQMFDKKLGDNQTRYFLQNRLSFGELKDRIENNLKNFYSKTKDCFLYKPFPQIKKVKILRG